MSRPSLRRLLLWCWHQSLVLALLALLGVAVLVGVARQLSPLIEHWRPDVEQLLTERTGVPVTLESLTAGQEGFGLRIHLQNLRLHSPTEQGQTLLSVPDVELRPSLWQSIWYREARVEVVLRGLQLHLDQLEDGQMRVRELTSLRKSDPETALQTLRYVLRQPALAVSESQVTVALHGYPVLRLSNVELVNRNDDRVHQLAGRVQVDGGAQALQLNIRLQGDVLDWQQSDLDIWASAPVRVLDGWLPTADVAGLRLSQLNGGGEYWLHFRQGRLQAMEAKPKWQEVVLQGNSERPLRIQNFNGELSWQRHAEGWQLAGRQLRGDLEGQSWPLPTLALDMRGEQLSVALKQTQLDGVSTLLHRLPLPEALSRWLQQSGPRGTLTAGRADLRHSETNGWQLEEMAVQARQLHASASPAFPGADGLSGWLYWKPAYALLGLDMRDGLLELPQVYREPVSVSTLSGFARLTRRNDNLYIDSSVLKVRNTDATGQAVLRLTLPLAKPGEGHLSLLGRLHQGRAVSAWRYVPWQPAGDKTLDWLRTAIQGGRVSEGDFLVDAPLHHKEDEHSVIQMRFNLQRGRLDYEEGWPLLRDLDAEVFIDGSRLTVDAKKLDLLEASHAQNVYAEIADFHHPVLQIKGNIASTGQDVMRLFRESPLQHHVGAIPQAIDVQGNVEGSLYLEIPLAHGNTASPVVRVDARLPGNVLYIRDADLQASTVRGELSYSTEKGLQANDIQAQLLQAPVHSRISSRMKKGELDEVLVHLEGNVGSSALKAWLGNGLMQYVSGETAYRAYLNIPAQSGAVPRLVVDSSLKGMRVALPAPLKKGVEAAPFSYQTTLGDNAISQLRYGQRLAAGLVWRDGQIKQAKFSLTDEERGGLTIPTPAQQGLEIEGRFNALDVAAWQTFLQKHQKRVSASEKGLPDLHRLKIESRTLDVGRWRLANAQINALRQENAWSFEGSSNELAGSLELPDSSSSDVRIALSRLQWPLPELTKAALPDSTSFYAMAKQPISLQIAGITLKEWPSMGALTAQAKFMPSPNGARVENIQVKNPVLQFTGQLQWQWRAGARTRLQGEAVSADTAKLLEALGYAPSLVSDNAKAVIDVSWPGNPEEPNLNLLDGRLQLAIERGRLLNISGGTSASRVFGWFDLENIKRRFKGDFSDVVRRGLSVDSIQLEGDVTGGVMPSAKLTVEGATLKANGIGKIDLAKQKIDQQLTVVLPVTSAVPLAALAVGGPIVGGAVAVAQLALDKQIDKVTQVRYRVSGDWDNPQVERMGNKPVEKSDTERAGK